MESLMRPLAAIFASATARMPPAVIGRPTVVPSVAVEDASSAACALRRGMRDCSMAHARGYAALTACSANRQD